MGVATGLVISKLATNQNIEVNEASIVCISLIANNIPDIDLVFKLKSSQAYIKNHRGISHSFVLGIIWIILLSIFGYLSTKENYPLYLIVASVGVISHIFTDLLNGYGVQFLWPIKKKWIALGITYTFDAIFLILHFIAFLCIIFLKTDIIITFNIVYGLVIVYIFCSYIYHYQLKKLLIRKYGKYKRLILQAKSTPINWKYVYETTDKKFYIGIVRYKTIIQLRYEKRKEELSNELEQELLKNHDFKTFIDFTPIFNYVIKHHSNDELDIRFYDLRYLMVRKNTLNYTFNCIVHIKNNKVETSFLGFTINRDNALKKFKQLKEKDSKS
jgi:inner membrane protein